MKKKKKELEELCTMLHLNYAWALIIQKLGTTTIENAPSEHLNFMRFKVVNA